MSSLIMSLELDGDIIMLNYKRTSNTSIKENHELAHLDSTIRSVLPLMSTFFPATEAIATTFAHAQHDKFQGVIWDLSQPCIAGRFYNPVSVRTTKK